MRRGEGGRKRSDEVPLLERVPPQSLEAEQAVLSAMLIEKEAIVRVQSMLGADDFYTPQHQALYQAMFDLFHSDHPVDLVTLGEKLRGGQQLEMVGGTLYLLQLQDAAPTAAAVRHYAGIVKRKSLLRQHLIATQSYQHAIWLAGDKEAEEALAERQAALVELLLQWPSEADWIALDDLLAMEIRVEWLVYPLIPLAAITLLLGDWEMHKSWFAQSLVHALARNSSTWLGHYPIARSGGALYLDGEKDEAAAKERMALFDVGMGRPAVTDSPWWEEEEEAASQILKFQFRPDILLGPHVGRLEARIREVKARLVVFDSVLALADPRYQVYSPEFWQRSMPALKRLAQRTHCAMLLIHHLRGIQVGGDNSLGARAFGGVSVMRAVDSAIGMEGEKGSQKRMVRHVKASLTARREPSFWVDFRPGDGGQGILAWYDGIVPDEAKEKRGEAKEIIRQLIVGDREYHTREIKSFVMETMAEDSEEKVDPRTLDRALKEMVDANELERPARGRYRKKDVPGSQLATG